MFNKSSWLYSLFLNKDESLNISLFISAEYHLVNVRQAEINHRDVVLSCFHTLNLESIIFSLELHHHLGPGGARRCRADPGRPPGIEASTIEANTAIRSIVRRDIGEDYRQMLKRMAK